MDISQIKNYDYQYIPVILGNLTNALGSIRSFSHMDIGAIVADDVDGLADKSKYCIAFHKIEGDFLENMLYIGRELEKYGKRGFLVPTTDTYVIACAKNLESLEKYFFVFTDKKETIETFQKKGKINPVLDKLGVTYPKSCFVENVHQIDDFKKSFTYPVIVKPEITAGFSKVYKKTIILNSDRETDQLVQDLIDYKLDQRALLVQEMIPGDESYIFEHVSYSNKGKIIGEMTCKILRQYPPYSGAATSAIFTPVEEKDSNGDTITSLGRKIIQEMEYTGIQATEFKLDRRDGVYKFIETNARTVIFISAFRDINCNLLEIAYRDLLGLETYEENLPLMPDREATWLIDFDDFIRATYSNRRDWPERVWSLKDYNDSLKLNKIFAVRDREDPAPFKYDRKKLMKTIRGKF